MNADGSSPHLITPFPPGEDAIVPEWSPDGAVIAFSVRYVNSDGLWRADLYTVTPDGVEVMRHNTGRFWFDVTWAPDGEEVAFTSCLGQAFAGCSVQTAGADGSEPVDVTPPDLGDARQPSWSPNGRPLLVLGGGPWPAGPIGLYKLRLPRP